MAEETTNVAEEATEVAEETVEVEEATKAEKSKKSGKKKWPIVVGVVAVVLVAAGAGFWTWHAQPSFCAAICHTPMDAYLATYDEGTTDKYGNELDAAAQNSMMALTHKNVDGTTCLDCHVPTMSEQISEGIGWVTGNYTIAGEQKNGSGMTYLDKRNTADLTEARGIPADEFCLNEACHTNADGSVMTRADLKELTADLSESRNPHNFQHGDYDCGICHQAHAQSINYCSSCHADAPIPEGWLSVSQAKQIQK